MYQLFVIFVLTTPLANGLDNGLALTPPMGWLSWLRYRCTTDCDATMENCISEALFKKVANDMITLGFKDAGYEFVIIDDCWLANERDSNGRLQPNQTRFPSGVKALADYIHSKGLKFGMYEDYGTKTCENYPGLVDHLQIDAETFADWEVDYLKIDGCNANVDDYNVGYPEFGQKLNQTGRPMVYSCSWPGYLLLNGRYPNYTQIAEVCNLWRNFYDIENSWESVTKIMDYFGVFNAIFAEHTSIGAWFDPDMLIIGNGALTLDQSRAQFALWAILAAPLLLSTDLSKLSEEEINILQNRDVIAVNQDRHGLYGKRIKVHQSKNEHYEIWTREINPVDGTFSYAVVVWNRAQDDVTVCIPLKDLKLMGRFYTLKDLYYPEKSPLKPTDLLNVTVAGNGAVVILTAVPFE